MLPEGGGNIDESVHSVYIYIYKRIDLKSEEERENGKKKKSSNFVKNIKETRNVKKRNEEKRLVLYGSVKGKKKEKKKKKDQLCEYPPHSVDDILPPTPGIITCVSNEAQEQPKKQEVYKRKKRARRIKGL